MNLLIIDDEKYVIESIRQNVDWEKTGIDRVYSATAVRQAEHIMESVPIEIILCDIVMPQCTGLELIGHFRDQGYEMQVIFLTSYARFEYAQKAITLDSVDYLLKPVTYAEFLTAARRALEWFELKGGQEAAAPPLADKAPRSILVKTEYRRQQIALDSILYISGLKDYVKICLEGEARPVLSLMSLKSLEGLLPADRFVRVHRSYIVQPSKVRVSSVRPCPSVKLCTTWPSGSVVTLHESVPASWHPSQTSSPLPFTESRRTSSVSFVR